jgi:hypothetical protein
MMHPPLVLQEPQMLVAAAVARFPVVVAPADLAL